MIRQRQFIFVKSKRLQLDRQRAGEFYREHQGKTQIQSSLIFHQLSLGKFFYSRLVHYMSWYVVLSVILKKIFGCF